MRRIRDRGSRDWRPWGDAMAQRPPFRERLTGSGCFAGMNGPSDYRERANHLRQLAEVTWQDDLEALLRRAARDYDEIADDLEAGGTEIRHNELIRE
jgi:hypothetical protein